MSSTGSIFQISVSRGGVPKRPVSHATVDLSGIIGDAQRDRRSHGHPEQALCLYSIEQLAALAAEGHTVFPGCTGENITTLDLDWRYVVAGAHLRLGETVLIEITGYAAPCWKNARWFQDGDFSQLDEAQHPGRGRAYARVLRGGEVQEGDRIEALIESAAERVWRLQPRTIRWPRDAG